MDQVQEVKEKTDIVTVIGEHVTLKKAGRHWKGLCPFHNEKSPSFTVSPELQMYKCFGCGKAGDVFTFLEEYEGLAFPDALKILADKAGVKLVQTTGPEAGRKDILYEVNDLAAKFYHYILLKHESGAEALKYFTEKRGLTLETIEAFLLGAAPENPQALFSFLTEKKKIPSKVLVDAGLVYKSDNGRFGDRFRGRAIFPIQNARGATIALAGRILPGPMEKKLAKYINSPETPIYHKSESLFGLPQARADIKRTGIAVVVEGEVDMISSWQSGVKNVLAIKGSALTDAHARILSRLAKTVILALDTDFAGGNAAMKGISEAQKFGLEVRVANLGEYKDPDEFARANPAGYKAALTNAVNVWDFIINLMFERYSIDTAQGKLDLSHAIMPYIAHIQDPILQAHYVRLIAGRLGVPEEAVEQSLKKQESAKETPKIEVLIPPERPVERPRRMLIEERLVLLLCVTGEKQNEIDRSLFATPKAVKILEHLDAYKKDHESFNLQAFVATLPPELSRGFIDTFLEEEGETTDALLREVVSLEKELTEIAVREALATLIKKIKSLDTNTNGPEISALQREIGELTKRLA